MNTCPAAYYTIMIPNLLHGIHDAPQLYVSVMVISLVINHTILLPLGLNAYTQSQISNNQS